MGEALKFFHGVAFGGFCGTFTKTDAPPGAGQVGLILSAGGRVLNCTVDASVAGTVDAAMGQRVWASGMAHYESHSGLPVKFDVISVEVRREGGDLTRWRGAFKLSEPDARS